MRVVLDANVIFPSVLREILIGVAAQGLFAPLWSERILREWVLAVARLGPVAVLQAEGEAALMRAQFRRAMVGERQDIEARLWLPDPNDRHVLATAIAGHADAILTFNRQDFPAGVLANEGVVRRDPDGFLCELWSGAPNVVGGVVAEVHAKAEAIAGEPVALRGLLKRAQLPRLGRVL